MNAQLQRSLHTAASWLTTALILQVLLTITTLPFLLGWHLPYTPLSLVGNIVFPFFLIVFLGLSSLFTVSVIIGFPASWIQYSLVITHRIWATALQWHPPLWWLRVQWWHLLPALLLGLSLWAWHTNALPHFLKVRAVACCGIIATYIALFGSAHTPHPTPTQLTRGRFTLTFTPYSSGTLELYDRGYISRASNTDALVDYEIVPHIISSYGQPARIKIGAHRMGTRLKKAKQLLKGWGL